MSDEGWCGSYDLGPCAPLPRPYVAGNVIYYFEDLHEGGDSGIDSDTEVRMNRINLEHHNDQMSDSCSSVDSMEENIRKAMLETPQKIKRSEVHVFTADGRQSPSLLEVELTASDDDDDASVLELVIPIQKKYQKVPTSENTKNPSNIWVYLCCFCR